MNNTIGILYELPCGSIANTYGYNGRAQTVSYYFDDDSGGHQTSMTEFQKWKPRRDLTDFPNARDPRLPYEFDLCWDIKYQSDLKTAIKHSHDDLDAIMEAVARHKIIMA